MRRLLVLAMAVMGVLCLSTAVLADGVIASADYVVLGAESGGTTSNTNYLTFFVEESFEAVEGGIWYSYSIGFEPVTPGLSETASIFGLFGGYRVVNNQNFSLAGMGSYLVYTDELDADGIGRVSGTQYDSVALGLKGSFSIKPMTISGLYLTGVYNTALNTVTRVKTNSGVNLSYIQVKGALQITNNLCFYGLYRLFSVGIGQPTEFAGYGGGIEYRF